MQGSIHRRVPGAIPGGGLNRKDVMAAGEINYGAMTVRTITRIRGHAFIGVKTARCEIMLQSTPSGLLRIVDAVSKAQLPRPSTRKQAIGRKRTPTHAA